MSDVIRCRIIKWIFSTCCRLCCSLRQGPARCSRSSSSPTLHALSLPHLVAIQLYLIHIQRFEALAYNLQYGLRKPPAERSRPTLYRGLREGTGPSSSKTHDSAMHICSCLCSDRLECDNFDLGPVAAATRTAIALSISSAGQSLEHDVSRSGHESNGHWS